MDVLRVAQRLQADLGHQDADDRTSGLARAPPRHAVTRPLCRGPTGTARRRSPAPQVRCTITTVLTLNNWTPGWCGIAGPLAAFDTETIRADEMRARIVGISLQPTGRAGRPTSRWPRRPGRASNCRWLRCWPASSPG